MEVRKITVVINSTNETRTIETDATTLGQLKSDLLCAGIETDGLVFFEGLTRTEMVDDESRLPVDVIRNGNVTNNLVFMLTRPKANIKSGADTLRTLLYSKVREYKLRDKAIITYGYNFTNCSNAELAELIEQHEEELKQKGTGVNFVLYNILDVLVEEDLMEEDLYDKLVDILAKEEVKEEENKEEEIQSPYTQEEIEDLFF